MDTFNFMLTILLMFMGIQFGQPWIVMAILVISVVTSKELSTTIALVIATGVLYFLFASGNEGLWVPAIFGLVVLAILLGNKPEEQPAGGLDMFGGMGGYGMGGMG